jgi:hypothetical protein
MEKVGFQRYGCDDMISERLVSKLGIRDNGDFEMHAWVGFPYEETHAERAKLYFETEIEVMQEIVNLLSQSDDKTDIVIDTSGSAVYVPPALLERLGKLTNMVYLAVTPEMIDGMPHTYLQKPVAVLWNGLFQPLEGESLSQSFARCYPKLLASRDELYRRYSHQIIHPEIHRCKSLSTQAFIGNIKPLK